ncbi:MAG: DUF488 family protein [Chloroflexi bacterium]|nr:DUF488 family protein [Chloroflexota bacterium]
MMKLKRAYQPEEPGDGIRVLVDRLWPRGLSRGSAAIDEWARELAPSSELRRWFGHKLEQWPEFRRLYRKELSARGEDLERLARMAAKGNVTLVYAAKDVEHNNARVLAEMISEIGSRLEMVKF